MCWIGFRLHSRYPKKKKKSFDLMYLLDLISSLWQDEKVYSLNI